MTDFLPAANGRPEGYAQQMRMKLRALKGIG